MGKMKEAFLDDRRKEEAMKERNLQDALKNAQASTMLKFSEMDISKRAIQEQAQNLIRSVEEGEVDPMKAFVYIKGVEAVLRASKTAIEDYAVEEFEKYGEKELTTMGSCEVSKVEAGVKYDFSNTEVWVEMKKIADEYQARLKDLESMLKTLKKPMETVWDDVLEELNPPIKTSKTTLKVAIK